jgi:outer membrane protein TolC
VRLVRVRYENGLAPMVALIDAQSALDRARSEAARADAGVAAALGELRFRAGVLRTGDAGSSRLPASGALPQATASAATGSGR